MEWKGVNCAVSKPRAEVVSDTASWAALWREAFGKEAPAADLGPGKGFAAAVFLGARPTGGFGVEFLEPRQEGGRTILPYRVTRPGPGMFVIQAFTTPWHIRVFRGDGSNAEVRGED